MQLVRPSTFPVGSLRRHSGTLAQAADCLSVPSLVDRASRLAPGARVCFDEETRVFAGSASGRRLGRRLAGEPPLLRSPQAQAHRPSYNPTNDFNLVILVPACDRYARRYRSTNADAAVWGWI